MKRQVLLLLLCLFPMFLYSHSGNEHATEAMNVLGFEENEEIRKWLEDRVSSMIDDYDYNRFYTNLTTREFKGFSYDKNHRSLFHWPYNGEAWCKTLDKKVQSYCTTNRISNVDSITDALKRKMKVEHENRKKEIKEKAKETFRFKDDKVIDFFCSMAYNVHILGDYEHLFDGKLQATEMMPDMNIVIKSMCEDISNFDKKRGARIKHKLEEISNKYSRNSEENNAKKADELMQALKEEIPKLIQTTKNGHIKEELEKKGFKLIKVESASHSFWGSIGQFFQRLWNSILNFFR